MKKLMYLINFELKHSIKKILLLCLAMAVMQNLIFMSLGWRRAYSTLRFENILQISNYALIFYITFIAIIGLQFYIFIKDYSDGRSIYTLMSLPSKRSYFLISKYASSIAAFLTLIAMQIINVYITYGLYLLYYNNTPGMKSGLYMAFNRDRFLSLFIPSDLPIIILYIAILISISIFTIFVIVALKGKRYISLFFLSSMEIIVFFLLFILTAEFMYNFRYFNAYEGYYFRLNSFILWIAAVIFLNWMMVKKSLKIVEANEIL
jgi:ABC-type transport system involved in multi-copper enzyme maturation permease subunit